MVSAAVGWWVGLASGSGCGLVDESADHGECGGKAEPELDRGWGQSGQPPLLAVAGVHRRDPHKPLAEKYSVHRRTGAAAAASGHLAIDLGGCHPV